MGQRGAALGSCWKTKPGLRGCKAQGRLQVKASTVPRELWGPSLPPLPTQMCLMLSAWEGILSRGSIMMQRWGEEVGWEGMRILPKSSVVQGGRCFHSTFSHLPVSSGSPHACRTRREDQASMGVPPQAASTSPMGDPRTSYRERPNSQHTAEK